MSSSPGHVATAHSESPHQATLLDRFGAILGREQRRDALAGTDPQAVCALAEDEGVLPLLAATLGARAGVPVALMGALAARAKILVAADLVRERELQELVAAFGDISLCPLLFKGAALAYTHYPRPDLRQRLDTDLLIRPADREVVEQVFARLGYERTPQFTGDLVSYQTPYVKRREGTVVHVVDVHWRLANPQAFAGVLSYDELLAEAQPIAPLGPTARSPGLVWALLLACVHRVAHHAGADRLIWLYDMYLLTERFDPPTWERFALLAKEHGVSAICADGLKASGIRLGTEVPADTLEQLTGAGRLEDRTAAYLRPNRRHLQTVASDLAELPSWNDRARLARQHAFPPASYMRNVYAPASNAPLAVLYFRRAVRGARRWLARP